MRKKYLNCAAKSVKNDFETIITAAILSVFDMSTVMRFIYNQILVTAYETLTSGCQFLN